MRRPGVITAAVIRHPSSTAALAVRANPSIAQRVNDQPDILRRTRRPLDPLHATAVVSGVAEPRDRLFPGLGPALSLKTNFSWTAAGNIGYAAGQWGTLVVIAKLGDPGLVGQFALAMAITTPIALLANMQLSSVQATDARHLYTFPDYLALRLVSVAFACLMSAIVAVATVSSRSTSIIVIIVALTKATDSVSDIFFGQLQQGERMRRVGVGMMLNGVLTLAAVSAAMLATRSLVWAGLGSLGASVTALVAYNAHISPAVPSRPHLMPRWSRPRLWGLARIALPLGVAGLCVSVNANLPRYFVQHYYGDRARSDISPPSPMR